MSGDKTPSNAAEGRLNAIVMWLTMYGVKGDLLPTIFDLKELWLLNGRERGKHFNLFFWWMYLVCLPLMIVWTLCGLIEGYCRWKDGKPLRDERGNLR